MSATKVAAGGRRQSLGIFTGRFRLPPGLKEKIMLLSRRIMRGEKKHLNASLIFIGDARMKGLNRRFLAKNKPTDVLSFPLEINGPAVQGEIYVSLPQARRQAHLFGNDTGGEILRLYAHGALHLLGYDHRTAGQRALMFKREEEYLRGLEISSSWGKKC